MIPLLLVLAGLLPFAFDEAEIRHERAHPAAPRDSMAITYTSTRMAIIGGLATEITDTLIVWERRQPTTPTERTDLRSEGR